MNRKIPKSDSDKNALVIVSIGGAEIIKSQGMLKLRGGTSEEREEAKQVLKIYLSNFKDVPVDPSIQL